jgi:hypothetical protein
MTVEEISALGGFSIALVGWFFGDQVVSRLIDYFKKLRTFQIGIPHFAFSTILMIVISSACVRAAPRTRTLIPQPPGAAVARACNCFRGIYTDSATARCMVVYGALYGSGSRLIQTAFWSV